MKFCPVCGGRMGWVFGRCRQCGRPPRRVEERLVLGLVLDRSGSMSSVGAGEIAGSANRFITEQSTTGRDAHIEVVCFDDEITVLRTLMPVSSVQPITPDEVRPRSMTALFDAVGKAIVDLRGRAERTILCVVTDGLENASREWTHERMTESLASLQEKNGWQVVWVGSEPAVVRQGVSAGIPTSHAAQYANTGAGYQAAMVALSCNAVRYVTGGSTSMSFSDEQREAMEES